MTDQTPDTTPAEDAKDAEAKTTPATAKSEAKAKRKTAAKPGAPKTQAPAKAEAGSITVIGPKAGFWRAGLRFDATPQIFAPGSLTAAQLKAIRAEPKLAVNPTE